MRSTNADFYYSSFSPDTAKQGSPACVGSTIRRWGSWLIKGQSSLIRLKGIFPRRARRSCYPYRITRHGAALRTHLTTILIAAPPRPSRARRPQLFIIHYSLFIIHSFFSRPQAAFLLPHLCNSDGRDNVQMPDHYTCGAPSRAVEARPLLTPNFSSSFSLFPPPIPSPSPPAPEAPPGCSDTRSPRR